MDSAAAWKVRGVGRETRVFAEEAARRAGLSLGDWLDEVDRRSRRRAGRRSRRSQARRSSRRDRRANRPPGAARRSLRRRAARPSANSSRAGRRDPMPTPPIPTATRAVATTICWKRRSPGSKAGPSAPRPCRPRADRLAAVEQRVERALEPRSRNLDARLDALARRVEAEPERPRAPSRQAERPRFDPQEAAMQIARRRSELDARAAPRLARRRGAGVGRDVARGHSGARRAARADAPRAGRAGRAGARRSQGAARGTRGDVAQPRRSRAAQRGRRARRRDRAISASASQRCATAAGATALSAGGSQRAKCATRCAPTIRRPRSPPGARNSRASAPRSIRWRRASSNPPPSSASASRPRRCAICSPPRRRGRCRSSGWKSRSANSPTASSVSPPAPPRRPKSARVGAMLADTRAQIERSTPAAALAAIERRLEDLAKRMDQALQTAGVERGDRSARVRRSRAPHRRRARFGRAPARPRQARSGAARHLAETRPFRARRPRCARHDACAISPPASTSALRPRSTSGRSNRRCARSASGRSRSTPRRSKR